MRRVVMLAVLALLAAGAFVLPASATAQNGQDTDGKLETALDRLGRPGLAATDLCGPDVPLLFVENYLLIYEPDQEDLSIIRKILSDILVDIEPVFSGSTFVIELDPGLGADGTIDALLRLREQGVPVGFNTVFTLHPFWRLKPFNGAHALDEARPSDPIAARLRRPVVVLDTGYPDDVPLPKYNLDFDSIEPVDRSVETALHGPFIAGQIRDLVGDPTGITLIRILDEAGLLAPGATGQEQVFDEVSMVGTLERLVQYPESIVNLSLGTYGCRDLEPTALVGTIDSLTRRGIEFVAAAGNDDTDAASMYPAALAATRPAVHSVGAHDGSGLRSCYSNFGPAIRWWAPGDEVGTTLPSAAASFLAAGTGTSFAAPFVAAALGAGLDPASVDGILPAVTGDDGSKAADCPHIPDDPCARPTHAGATIMFGTDGPDVMRGTPEPDFINARPGDDIVCAGGKNDVVKARAGNDIVYGGLGSDVIEGGSGNDFLVGENGNDFIHGGAGIDVCLPGNGNANDVRLCEG